MDRHRYAYGYGGLPGPRVSPGAPLPEEEQAAKGGQQQPQQQQQQQQQQSPQPHRPTPLPPAASAGARQGDLLRRLQSFGHKASFAEAVHAQQGNAASVPVGPVVAVSSAPTARHHHQLYREAGPPPSSSSPSSTYAISDARVVNRTLLGGGGLPLQRPGSPSDAEDGLAPGSPYIMGSGLPAKSPFTAEEEEEILRSEREALVSTTPPDDACCCVSILVCSSVLLLLRSHRLRLCSHLDSPLYRGRCRAGLRSSPPHTTPLHPTPI